MMDLRLLGLRCLGTYLRHAPDHPGKWRLIGPAVTLAPAFKAVRDPFAIRIREGFRLLVDGSSQTSRILYATGEYEAATTRLIQRLLQPGQTMVDVGANIGYFSVLGARRVGPHGRVIAFEPSPDVRQRLVENLRLNQIETVTVRGEALADAAGEATFYAGPEQDTGLASLRPLRASRELRVRQARLDDLLPANERISLIKIDVEGAEMSALRGMTGCLSRDSPDLILEVTDAYLRGLGSSAQSLLAFIADHGYTMYEIQENGRLLRVDARHLANGPAQFNALATTRKDVEALP